MGTCKIVAFRTGNVFMKLTLPKVETYQHKNFTARYQRKYFRRFTDKNDHVKDASLH